MNAFIMRHRVLLGCVAVCAILIAIYFLMGKGGGQGNPVATKFFDAIRASDFQEAATICRENTPFPSGGENSKMYYAHFCLVYVACQAKPAGYGDAVSICRKIESTSYVEGDDKISGEQCVQYITGNC
jgi:hypothetical protein